ncbi:hypothetical protein G5I_03093 [Acromyrmex echinatior]|uniref:Uncharacterized protein n=1 Tax=Acromyrmex echinatior TaxID=103372 RepID=F4WC21_ACREC|nr:hypothetical protein G5I_03093 [Acromyrmex echinatior]
MGGEESVVGAHRNEVLIKDSVRWISGDIHEAGDSRDLGRVTPPHRREEEEERPGLGVKRRPLPTDPHDT